MWPHTTSTVINGKIFSYFSMNLIISEERLRILDECMKMYLHTNEAASAGEKPCSVETANCKCKSIRDSAFMFARDRQDMKNKPFSQGKLDINSARAPVQTIPSPGNYNRELHS